MTNGCFKHVSSKFQDVLGEFPVCFKKVLGAFHEPFKGVSRKFGCFMVFQECWTFYCFRLFNCCFAFDIIFQRGYKVL